MYEEVEEHNIWNDNGIESSNPNTLISFLELYKYRYEKSFHKPVSCHDVLLMVGKYVVYFCIYF